MQATHGLSSSDNLKRFKAKDCQQCLRDIFSQFDKRIRMESWDTRLAVLTHYLNGESYYQALPKGKKVTTLHEYCQALVTFATKAEELTSLTNRLNLVPPQTRSNADLLKQSAVKPLATPQVNALESAATDTTKGKGKGSDPQECILLNKKKRKNR